MISTLALLQSDGDPENRSLVREETRVRVESLFEGTSMYDWFHYLFTPVSVAVYPTRKRGIFQARERRTTLPDERFPLRHQIIGPLANRQHLTWSRFPPFMCLVLRGEFTRRANPMEIRCSKCQANAQPDVDRGEG